MRTIAEEFEIIYGKIRRIEKEIDNLQRETREYKPNEKTKKWIRLNKESMNKYKIPICPICLKKMRNLKRNDKIERFSWVCDCKDFPKNMAVGLL